MNGLQITNVSKRFGDTQALDNVSLNFAPGKIYGLLGRNGAGKTTLLNILTGRIFADGGQVTLDGEPVLENDKALRQIYMLSEQMLYPEKLRVRDAFKDSAMFYPNFDLDYANTLAQRFALDTKKKTKSLSTGYKTIFKICVALATGAPYLLLDEPVLGLDANHRDLFYRTVLQHYAEKPSCIVLSTHLVEEVSALVEDVVIVKDGRVLRNETRDSLLAQGYTVSGSAEKVDAFIAGKTVLGVDTIGGLKSAYLLGEAGAVPDGLEVTRLDLQRLFVQLTN